MLKKESNNSQLIIYQTETGQIKIDVRFQDETVWLSQQLMADLFQTTKQNVSLHIKNIFEDGELSQGAVVKDFLTTASDSNFFVLKTPWEEYCMKDNAVIGREDIKKVIEEIFNKAGFKGSFLSLNGAHEEQCSVSLRRVLDDANKNECRD